MPETQTPEEKPVENIADVIPVKTEDPKIETIDTAEADPGAGEPEAAKRPFLLLAVVALVAFSLGAVAGGLIMFRQNAIAVPKEITAPEDAESSPSAQPTASASADLTKYDIEVLNGSDIKGAAGTLKDELTKAGFNVANAGNATSSAFIKTVLSTKKEIDKDYLSKLQEFLQKSHALSINQDLKTDAKTDILIIIGAE